MRKKHVWISDNLYKEIEFTKKFISLNDKKNKKITMIEASDRIAIFLNKLRNKKNNIELPKI